MTTKAPEQCIFECKYGTYNYISKRRLEYEDGYLIEAVYTNQHGAISYDHFYTSGKDDWSRPQAEYHSKCPWCWLGYAHTEWEHSRLLIWRISQC